MAPLRERRPPDGPTAVLFGATFAWSALLPCSGTANHDDQRVRSGSPTGTALESSRREDRMLNVKKQRRALSLQPDTVRRLTTVDLAEIVGGVRANTLPCSIPCTGICSSGM